MMKAKVFGAAAGLALAVAASAPAQAQFMSSPYPYPVIIVPPPPAQNFVLPKPAPRSATPDIAKPPSDAREPDLSQCHHGRTNVCP